MYNLIHIYMHREREREREHMLTVDTYFFMLFLLLSKDPFKYVQPHT
jgi:hypothetical protein